MVVQVLKIYRGFSHELRLRIVCLLAERPLCVQHLQQILDASQVEISKQLAYLKDCKLVEFKKHHNWRIYTLSEPKTIELQRHVDCLQCCVRATAPFSEDLKRLKGVPIAPLQRRSASRDVIEPVPIPEEEPVGLESHLL
jgi:ArsR family transcriptional regulator